MDLQPTLRGTLIEVRPLQSGDFEELLSAASDPLIWEQHPDSDRHKRDIFEQFFKGAIESKGAFAVVDIRSGRIIGSSRYWNYNPEQNEIEIGWTFLQRAFWGGEYNRELKRLMLEHAFRFVDRVLLIVGENNLRSQKAVQKIGGTFLKTVERPGRDGQVRKNIVFVITREKFLKNKELGAVSTPG